MRPTAILLLPALVLAGLACSSGGGGESPSEPAPPPPATRTVELVDNAYSPQQLTINPGDTVRWVLQGADPSHTVTARDGAFDSGFVFARNGDAFERTFTDADAGRTFEYSCRTHKDCCLMQGSVRVGQNAPLPSPGY